MGPIPISSFLADGKKIRRAARRPFRLTSYVVRSEMRRIRGKHGSPHQGPRNAGLLNDPLF